MIELYKIYAFVFGIFIGSFVNVLIYRIPREKNIALPRSSCISCGKLIKWYLNIPILSFLILRGKCFYCKTLISWRYPFVEFIVGLMSFYLFPSSLDPKSLILYLLLLFAFCIFVAHFFIDLEFHILPDSLNATLALLFLGYGIFWKTWQHWAVGGLLGFGLPFGVTWVFYKIKNKIGLGGGDIKLYTTLGLFLGPVGLVHNIFYSCFLGALIGIGIIIIKKQDKDIPMAFGPYIILVAVLQIYFPQLVELIPFKLIPN